MLMSKYTGLTRLDPCQTSRLFARAEKMQIDKATLPNAVVATAIAAKVDYFSCEDAPLLAIRQKSPVRILSALEFVSLLEPELPVTSN